MAVWHYHKQNISYSLMQIIHILVSFFHYAVRYFLYPGNHKNHSSITASQLCSKWSTNDKTFRNSFLRFRIVHMVPFPPFTAHVTRQKRASFCLQLHFVFAAMTNYATGDICLCRCHYSRGGNIPALLANTPSSSLDSVLRLGND